MITRSSPSAEVLRQAQPRRLSPFYMLFLAVVWTCAGAIGAAIVSKGIANLAHDNLARSIAESY